MKKNPINEGLTRSQVKNSEVKSKPAEDVKPSMPPPTHKLTDTDIALILGDAPSYEDLFKENKLLKNRLHSADITLRAIYNLAQSYIKAFKDD